MAGQRADELAGASLRPQVRVDLPDRAGLGVRRADPGQLGGHPGRGGDRRVVGEQRLPVGVQRRLGHEQDVDVGDVVELLGAALAQPDHRQPGLQRVLPDLGAADGQGGLERGVGQVGELVGDLRHRLDRLRCAQVAGRDPQDHARGRPGAARHRSAPWPPAAPASGSAPTASSSIAAQFRGRALLQGVVEHVEMLGVGDQVLSEGGAAAEDEDQVPGQLRRSLRVGRTGRARPPPAGRGWSAPGPGRPLR